MALKIALGGDHAGYSYKKELISFLQSKGYETKDFGAFSEESVDYPDFAHPLALAVEKKEFDFGILLCGSGNGVNITANKHQGIRSGLAWNPEVASLIRKHNNANVMALPARFISLEQAKECVEVFLGTTFEGGRHQNRVDKIPC
ncbi:MAG TPA: ribose 5-phosphate isomerase B [Cytophagaceae bacterium]|jgi:ribose 5-phosphate isomerase B|nr:ribose 5-phosphate isomerase B [Cytophagaceae bacterium]